MHNSLVEKGTALSRQANENKTRNLAIKAGVTKFKAAPQTLLNIIYKSKYI
ncbi:MAG TPA: hypothetical protein VJP58_07140 [Candidatus Nitrosocosmicus sp.]|nr:hypothetical protein [Candidatus Nitrosocosmicus sp.]